MKKIPKKLRISTPLIGMGLAIVIVAVIAVILQPWNDNVISKNNKVTSETMGYLFHLPEDWKSYISDRSLDQPEAGQYGDLEPPLKMKPGKLCFSRR